MISLAIRTVNRLLRPISYALQRNTRALSDAIHTDGQEQVARHYPSAILDNARTAIAFAQHSWDAYWQQVVIPSLTDHQPPPLADGFRTWTGAETPSARASTLIVELASLEDRLLTYRP